jgi:uncharacterized membrane protein
MNLYTILKYVHVLSAVTAVGANITYALWLARSGPRPDHLPFTLRTIKIMDTWIANPAYILLLPTGYAMTRLAGWSLTTPWILVSLILYGILAAVGLALYSPTLRKQVALAENPGPASPEYKRIAGRSTAIGIILNLLALVIIFFMVAKPALWAP